MKRAAMTQKKREAWLDYARIFAILCVICCHAVENYYGAVVSGNERIDFVPWIVENTLFTIGRLGVPLFLAISGTLLLNREKDVFSFYKKSVLPLIATTEIWAILNYFFAVAVYRREFSFTGLLKQMLFLDDSPLSHMWYMPMIIGLYIFVPFLSKIFQQYGQIEYYIIPLLLVAFGSVIIPTLTVFLNEDVLGVHRIALKINTAFGGGVYGLYFVVGFFIGRKGLLKKIKATYLLLAMVFWLFINTIGQYYIYQHQFYTWDDLLWYTSAPIFVMGLVLFEIFRRLGKYLKNINYPVVTNLAKSTFGIYLLHNPVRLLCSSYLPMDGLNEMLKIIILFVASLGISIIILLPFMLKWKKAGKILFYIK